MELSIFTHPSSRLSWRLQPINYAVINGEEKTGATTFFINEKIDEGNILLQEEIEILPDENAGSLHDRLMEMGAQLIVKTLDRLSENSITEKPQPHVEHPKNAFKIFKKIQELISLKLQKKFTNSYSECHLILLPSRH